MPACLPALTCPHLPVPSTPLPLISPLLLLPACLPAPCRSQLHDHFPVVPDLIRSYIQQVQGDLHLITNSPGQRLLTWQAGGTRRGCTAPHWCGSRLRVCVRV